MRHLRYWMIIFPFSRPGLFSFWHTLTSSSIIMFRRACFRYNYYSFIILTTKNAIKSYVILATHSESSLSGVTDGAPSGNSSAETLHPGYATRFKKSWVTLRYNPNTNPLFVLRIDTLIDFGLSQLILSLSHWFWIGTVILDNCAPMWHGAAQFNLVIKSTEGIGFRQIIQHYRSPMPLSNANAMGGNSTGDNRSRWNSPEFARSISIKE